MRTELLRGYFDVKEYNASKPKEQWKTKREGETITFTSTREDNGDAKLFEKSFTDKNGNKKIATIFKIGSKCKWFNAGGELVEKPLNENLDKQLFEVCIDFNLLQGNADAHEACGRWVNGLQFRKVEQLNFAPMGLSPESATSENLESKKEENDLPF